jgi:two-component system response regulator (stage 0 sporulation protein A)
VQNDTKQIEVLIVDDNKEFCQILVDFFKMNEDFMVSDIAYNGEEALDLIKQGLEPDILIIDLIMPQLDGIGVLEELNEQNLINDMKIIALTAFGQEQMMKTVIELGVDYYIMKPFDLDKLITRIKQLMDDSKDEQDNVRYVSGDNDLNKEELDYTALITSILHEMGVPAHIKGYHYIRHAVELVVDDIDLLGAVTKKLYPEVAEEFNSTSSRVERSIRHAIEVVWDRGNEKALVRYFASNMQNENSKPTNSQFIARIADKIRIDNRVS